MTIDDRPNAAHILEVLDKLGCDLIMMGTQRRCLKRLLFGSMTEDVVRLARCPVMVANAPAHNDRLAMARNSAYKDLAREGATLLSFLAKPRMPQRWHVTVTRLTHIFSA